MKFKDREVPMEATGKATNAKYTVNMNEIVGENNILFICLDTLRYDIALQEQENNGTPILNKYGKWQKCHAPGNYTLSSHMAMFTGHMPSPAEPTPLFERERLFIPKERNNFLVPKEAFCFEGASWVEGLEKVGYETICVGGVAFFNKRTDINKILPNMFKKSYWHPSFSCHIPNGFENQLDLIERKLNNYSNDERLFMYVNIDSIHYPNNFYIEGAEGDSLDSHAAALRYVDKHLERLFDMFSKKGKTFVMVCSDHGSCYGEDGYYFHCLSNEIVYTVPYKHFFIGK